MSVKLYHSDLMLETFSWGSGIASKTKVYEGANKYAAQDGKFQFYILTSQMLDFIASYTVSGLEVARANYDCDSA